MLAGTVARRTFPGSDGQPASCSGRASADSGLSSLSPELHGVDPGHDLLLQPLEVVERLRNRHILERRPEKRHRQPDLLVTLEAVGDLRSGSRQQIAGLAPRSLIGLLLRDDEEEHAADTFASLLLAANAPITYVSAQLGHLNPSTTLRYYARWIPNKGRRWVDLLDRVSEAVAAAAEAVSSPIWNQIWNQPPPKSQIGHSGDSE